VVRAAAFPGDSEASGGLLLDLASDLRVAADERRVALGRTMSARLREPGGVGGDRHRQRRLLVQDLADAFGDLGGTGPLLVVLEDLHWADELSLEVVGHLAARLPARPLLGRRAYRSDELYPRLPLRRWRARLLPQRLAEEIRLPRLDPAQTAALAGALLGHPPPAGVAAAVHDRSDGIPCTSRSCWPPCPRPPPGPTPPGWRPGRARAGWRPSPCPTAWPTPCWPGPGAGRALDGGGPGAVIGRSFELDLLGAVGGLPADAVDHGLGRLRERYLVQSSPDQSGFDFRHALIRDVLYGDVPPGERRRLHRLVATAAAGRGYGDAFVSAHFDQAEPAHRHALAAAREASAVSAHREALELYRRAERNLPADLPAREHAALLVAIGDEAAASDDNSAALAAYQQAHQLLAGAGDDLEAAAVVARWCAVAHLLGEDLAARARRLEAALASVPAGEATRAVRAELLSGLAAATCSTASSTPPSATGSGALPWPRPTAATRRR
jgi:hypothetical protein